MADDLIERLRAYRKGLSGPKRMSVLKLSRLLDEAIAELDRLHSIDRSCPFCGGEADIGVAKAAKRLRQHRRQALIWDEISEEGDTGTEPIPQILKALRESIDIGLALAKRATLKDQSNV